MINFQKLHYFCAMVEEGGIHKAARRLGLSQPPLSVVLRELEKELECQLIFRSGHNWIVTDAGQRLYEEGRAILARTGNLAETIRQAGAQVRGDVRCGFSTSCVSIFRQVLPIVAEKYKDVSTHVIFTDSERLAGGVRQRQIDFALLYLPVDGSDFDITPLVPQRLVALFSPLVPAPGGNEIGLAEICDYPLLLPHRWKGGGIYAIFARELQRLSLSPRIICHSQSSYILRDLLELMPAVAILPECETEIGGSRKPECRQVRELKQPITPAIVTLKNTFLPLPAMKFVSLLREGFKEGRGNV